MSDVAIAPAALSIMEAAKYLNVSKNTIYRLMDAGQLASSRILDRRLILRSDLDSLLMSSRDTAGAAR